MWRSGREGARTNKMVLVGERERERVAKTMRWSVGRSAQGVLLTGVDGGFMKLMRANDYTAEAGELRGGWEVVNSCRDCGVERLRGSGRVKMWLRWEVAPGETVDWQRMVELLWAKYQALPARCKATDGGKKKLVMRVSECEWRAEKKVWEMPAQVVFITSRPSTQPSRSSFASQELVRLGPTDRLLEEHQRQETWSTPSTMGQV